MLAAALTPLLWLCRVVDAAAKGVCVNCIKVDVRGTLEKRDTVSNSSGSRSKKPAGDSVASQYALQVALQTMKERCQQLQQRLAAEEEENLRLRMTLTSVRNCSGDENESDDEKVITNCPRKEVTSSEEKIARLSRQNSQLRHHLFLVASENRQLWCRLSSLTEANESLGNQLSKISLSLANQSTTKLPELGNGSRVLDNPEKDKTVQNQDKDNMTSVHLGENKIVLPSFAVAKSYDLEDQSLEEMSIKLLKNLLQEKIGLEQQYAEMVKMHSESSSFGIPNLDFGYFESCDDSTLEQLGVHYGKLCEMREMMKAHRNKLKVALDNFSSRRNEASCDCLDKATMTVTPVEVTREEEVEVRRWGGADLSVYSADIRQQLDLVAEPPDTNDVPPPVATQDNVRICPLCRQLYHMTTSTFDDFVNHVYAHFQVEDELDLALDNFEVIPK
ncbi:hypothetical protein PR048_029700 [Dryococelus australis]|uniref:UBZ1-type domain-containing protein n=1 Tax=Dryococelus australis TaxID=614101 RepID=A0ABQ9GGH3_9NEOP|nr:hypothetical protein PR048_029700 [Dryococelus australis]